VSVAAEPISPDLVLVLPEEERRAILATLPRRSEEILAMLGSSLEAAASPESPGAPCLSPPRIAAAAAAYLIWQIACVVPYCAGAFLATFLLALLLASLA
jgi:hypothetical protein